jgi:hypothetical protein
MRLSGLKLFGCASVAALGLTTAAPASAGLIFDSSVLLSGQGFGSAPRDLTIHQTGPSTSPESGCVSPTGGFSVGAAACLGIDAASMGNSVVNAGGDEPMPHADDQKYGAPFASDRGITTASDIGILFNAAEPGGDGIDVLDLTLKFYRDGMLVGSIDGQHSFGSTNPGNGVAGFVFRVDSAHQAYVDTLLAMGNIQFALESTLAGSAGGPESYRIVNLAAGGSTGGGRFTIPEPTSVLLVGLGVVSALRRSNRRKAH